MFSSVGIIYYNDSAGFRLTVEVDPELSDYYRSLIPKYYKVQKPRWSAHITVVRPEKEIPPKLRYWGEYEDEKIEFFYDPYIYRDKGYFWINTWCKRLEHIREELGLTNISKYTLPPTGLNKCFHCTIGNYKENFSPTKF